MLQVVVVSASFPDCGEKRHALKYAALLRSAVQAPALHVRFPAQAPSFRRGLRPSVLRTHKYRVCTVPRRTYSLNIRCPAGTLGAKRL
jgi:hypothetical protein